MSRMTYGVTTLKETGILKSGKTTVDGVDYFFDLTKYKLMTTGLINANGTYYYTNKNGVLQKGFQEVGNNWYYFGEDYTALKGWQEIDGLKYYFGEDGVRYKGVNIVDGKPYFFGITKGKLMYGWIYYDGLVYYIPIMSRFPKLAKKDDMDIIVYKNINDSESYIIREIIHKASIKSDYDVFFRTIKFS